MILKKQNIKDFIEIFKGLEVKTFTNGFFNDYFLDFKTLKKSRIFILSPWVIYQNNRQIISSFGLDSYSENYDDRINSVLESTILRNIWFSDVNDLVLEFDNGIVMQLFNTDSRVDFNGDVQYQLIYDDTKLSFAYKRFEVYNGI